MEELLSKYKAWKQQLDSEDEAENKVFEFLPQCSREDLYELLEYSLEVQEEIDRMEEREFDKGFDPTF